MIDIRSSSLTGYNDCARKTIFSVARDIISDDLKKQKIPGEYKSSIGALVGTGTHAAADHQLSVKKITGTHEGTLKDSQEIGVNNLDTALQEDEVLWDNTTTSRNDAQNQLLTMSKSYYLEVAPNISPLLCEEQFYAKINNNYELSGKIDLLTTDGVLRDLKTGVKMRSHHEQIGGYSILCKSNKKMVNSACVDFLPRVKKDKIYSGAENKIYNLELAENIAKNTIKCIIRDIEMFKKTGLPDHISANPNSMLCSEKYCNCFNSNFCPISQEK